jgi:hypothetical protein
MAPLSSRFLFSGFAREQKPQRKEKTMETQKERKIFSIFSIEPSTKYEGKNFWRQVGVGFVNRDGSFRLKPNQILTPQMDLQLREKQEKRREA